MGDPGAPTTIGTVLHLRLGTLVAELHIRDSEIRDGVADGLHQARVTCRRLRAALATLRPVLLREVVDPVRDDLQWLALALGDARDVEVLRARLPRLVAETVEPEQRDAVRRRIDRLLEELDQTATARVEATLASERYHRLLVSLDRLVAHPPWTGKASRPAAKVLHRRLDKEAKRVGKEVAAAVALGDHSTAYDVVVHDVRKAVKRLRYAWELAEPVLGAKATRQLTAAKQLTKRLGERQDIVLTLALLPRLERDAAADGEPTRPWERLRRVETERASHIAAETLDMLKSGILSAGVAVREK